MHQEGALLTRQLGQLRMRRKLLNHTASFGAPIADYMVGKELPVETLPKDERGRRLSESILRIGLRWHQTSSYLMAQLCNVVQSIVESACIVALLVVASLCDPFVLMRSRYEGVVVDAYRRTQ